MFKAPNSGRSELSSEMEKDCQHTRRDKRNPLQARSTVLLDFERNSGHKTQEDFAMGT